MKSLKQQRIDQLVIGFALFSMFFGAGNLIFPPHLGAQAGTNFWPSFLGLAISAVGLPIAGVIAIAKADGLDKLAGRVHPVFAQVFMILIYLSIGPCLAIPRTASTSFAMLTPLLGSSAGLQLGYSVLFFGAAFLVALHPDRLTRWLGRLLCPCLLVLILILFGGCLLHPLAAQYGAPTDAYSSAVILQGVLYGYQTMDALAALVLVGVQPDGSEPRGRFGGGLADGIRVGVGIARHTKQRAHFHSSLSGLHSRKGVSTP